jgi:hypothetical protein
MSTTTFIFRTFAVGVILGDSISLARWQQQRITVGPPLNSPSPESSPGSIHFASC